MQSQTSDTNAEARAVENIGANSERELCSSRCSHWLACDLTLELKALSSNVLSVTSGVLAESNTIQASDNRRGKSGPQQSDGFTIYRFGCFHILYIELQTLYVS